MAAPKTPTAPTAPKAQTPAPAPAPTQANGEEKKEKKRGIKQQEIYPTAAAALEESSKREKGARRPFTVKYDGKETHVVAHSEHHAAYIVAVSLPGFEVIKLKGRESKPKQLGLGALMEMINSLPEADRAAVMAQLGGKK